MRALVSEMKPALWTAEGKAEGESESLTQRVAALEDEHRSPREVIEAQAEHLEELEQRTGALEEGDQQRGEAGVVKVDDSRQQEWRPPRREHGLPDAGVVTLEKQPVEEHAFGPAADRGRHEDRSG